MKWIYRALCTVLIVVMAVSAWKIWSILKEYRAGEETYQQIETYINLPTVQPPDPAIPEDETECTEEFPVVDFESLRKINSDIVGWIYIPGTSVNYPVVQGSDNSYYLNRLFTKEWNSAGSIFMDYRNDAQFGDVHTVIYGHQMNNRTMFNDLKLYEEQSFYDEQPIGYLLTPDVNYRLEFFSGYVSSVDSNAWDLNFAQGEYEDWLSELKRRSAFTSPVEPLAEDRVVTLSTCSSAFENARFVLHARLSPGEIE